MSEVLHKALGELTEIVAEPKPRKRKQMLEKAAKREDIIQALVELSQNTVLKNVPLDSSKKEKLVRHANCLMKCSKIRKCNKKAHKIAAQSGGWLQFVLPAAISLLLSNFGDEKGR